MNPLNPYSRQLEAMADELARTGTRYEPMPGVPAMPLPELPVRLLHPQDVPAGPPAPPVEPSAAGRAAADAAVAVAERPGRRGMEHAPVEMRRATPTTPPPLGAQPLSPIAAVLAWLPAAAAARAAAEAAALEAGGGAALVEEPAVTVNQHAVATPAHPMPVVPAAAAPVPVTPVPVAQVPVAPVAPAPAPAAPPVEAAPAPTATGPVSGWVPQPTLGYVPTQRGLQASAPLRTPPGPSRGAVLALVAALLGLGPVAVVLGHLALRDSRRSARRSHDVALVALALGYVGVVVLLLVVAALAGLPLAADLLPPALTGPLGLG